MQVSRSGYYAWRKRGKSSRQRENERLIPFVRTAHKKSKETYGARRIAIEVKALGISCGRFKAGTLMKLAGVAAKQKKKFKATTDSKHNLPIAPNLLNRQFEVKEPDRVSKKKGNYCAAGQGREVPRVEERDGVRNELPRSNLRGIKTLTPKSETRQAAGYLP